MCSCNRGRQPAPAGTPAPNPAARPALRPRPAAVAVAAVAAVPAAAAPAVVPTVDTSIWGAPLWLVLHTASVFTRNRGQIPLWRTLVFALKTGLPCPDCSTHYNAWVSDNGLRFSMIGDGIRGPIVRWIAKLHNDVNQRTGNAPWTVQQIMDAYGSKDKAVKAAKIAAAVAALQSLQGIIGAEAYTAALALLNSLA